MRELDRVRLGVMLCLLESKQYGCRMQGLRELEKLVDAAQSVASPGGFSFGRSTSSFPTSFSFGSLLSGGSGGACNPPELFSTPQELHRWEVPLYMACGEFERWLAEHRVLSLCLAGNLDQSHYMDRVKPLVEFLAPKFIHADIQIIWLLQVLSSPSILQLFPAFSFASFIRRL